MKIFVLGNLVAGGLIKAQLRHGKIESRFRIQTSLEFFLNIRHPQNIDLSVISEGGKDNRQDSDKGHHHQKSNSPIVRNGSPHLFHPLKQIEKKLGWGQSVLNVRVLECSTLLSSYQTSSTLTA